MVGALLAQLTICALRPSRGLSTVKMQALAMAELPVVDAAGGKVDLMQAAAGKRVALYYTAGWCPMCRSFEPALDAFLSKNDDVYPIMVSSDRSASDASQRAKALGMPMVQYDVVDALKQKHQVWAGSESMKLGFGRRSGVPALVVVDAEGEEVAFVDAERRGAGALDKWPKDIGRWP